MKRHARTLIAVFAALGLAASIAALYVHYRLLADPSYTSFCDVSETVSCEAVMTSQYGYLFGVPVAAGGAIWSALVLLLAWVGMRQQAAPADKKAARPDDSGGVAGYIFVLSTIGLAAGLYLAYASFFVLRQACPLCMAMYVSILGVFIVSGAAAADLGTLPARLAPDLRAVTASPVAVILAAVWLAASIGLVVWFPREEPVAASATAEPVAVPTETLGADEVAQFEAWLGAQPRVSLDVPSKGVRVVVVKFNDYQCPACRQAYIAYKSIQQKYETEYRGQVIFLNVDYPLEAECNTGGIHAAACEAAVAVRLARAKNRDRELEEWLFDNQPTLTRDTVKKALADIAQVTDFDAQYANVLQDVRADAQKGQKLEINGTPTFFINGIRIASTLRPAYFDAAIAYELKRTQTQQ